MDQIDRLSEGHVLSTQFQAAGLIKIAKIVAGCRPQVLSKLSKLSL